MLYLGQRQDPELWEVEYKLFGSGITGVWQVDRVGEGHFDARTL